MCHYFDKVGHTKKDCHKRTKEKLGNNKNEENKRNTII